MAGAGPNTLRVRYVNANWSAGADGGDANWSAGADGGDGEFAVLIVTEDEQRHSVPVSSAAVSALLQLVRDSPVLLWDSDARADRG